MFTIHEHELEMQADGRLTCRPRIGQRGYQATLVIGDENGEHVALSRCGRTHAEAIATLWQDYTAFCKTDFNERLKGGKPCPST